MISVLLITMSLMLVPVEDPDDVSKRLEHAAEVLDELLNSPDADIPQGILDEAECIAVTSQVRGAAFGFGFAALGGPVSCRLDAGWSAPAMLAIDWPVFGFQIGVHKDTVLLFMAEDSVEYMTGNEHPPGPFADGPKSRDLRDNINFTSDADVLRYSRSRGVYARIELSSNGPPGWGPDRDANRVLYGREISAEEILLQGIPAPDLAAGFMAAVRSN